MSEVVNLNKARKDRARAEAAVQASRNRVAHGLTKSQKATARALAAKAATALDGQKRDP